MEHTLTVKKVIAGGKGLGTLADGMVVMVAGVLPGETAVVRETRTRRGYKEVELVQVVEASPDRVAPPCPHYGVCGGCDLQHASYPAQLIIKRQIVREALERAHVRLPSEQPGPTLPSPQSLTYRSRLRLHLDPWGRLGFHQGASNTVAPVRQCLLAVAPLNRLLSALVDDGWPARLAQGVAAVELLHSPEDDRVMLSLHARTGACPLEPGLVAELHTLADAVLTDLAGTQSEAAPATLSQDFPHNGATYRLTWDHRCFYQVNTQQNPRMIALALDLIPRQDRPWTALDLFCGMGNFSIALALRGATVTGIEHNRHSIRWAGHNSRQVGIANARFIAADVARQLQHMVDRRTRFDCILLDPPRQGLGPAAAFLPRLRPKRIIAISCDPATQARDLALLTREGYQLRQITPVDMFPQTHHIESVALLESD